MTTPVVVDYETYWGPDYTLSKMTTEAYIRDDRFIAQGAGIKIGQGPSVWVPKQHLKAVLARIPWNEVALVGHHLNFDGSILAWRYGHTPKLNIDTLSLSRAIVGVNSPRHSLEVISELLLGLKKYPGFLKETYGMKDWTPEVEDKAGRLYCAGPIDPTGKYAGDVMLTWEVLKKLLPYMPADELHAADWAIRIFTQPTVFFDYDMLVRYNQEIQESRASAMRAIDDLVVEYMKGTKVKVPKGKDPKLTVVRSNDHYANVLRMLGVEPPVKWAKASKKFPEGRETYAFAATDEEHKALLEHDNPVISTLVATRIEIKSSIEVTRSQSYLEAAPRGAWPIHLNYAGAHTVRFSGGRGAGGNPQNLKRGGTLRDAICAPEGKIFFVSDLSQIEARIALWVGMQMASRNAEAEALDVMRNGGDIYSYFGSIIYGMEITKKTHPYERQVAKSAVLGLGFGMGWKRFIDYCKQNGIDGMTEEEAKRIVNIYRSMFSGIKESWKYIQDEVLPAMLDGFALNFPSNDQILTFASRDFLFNEPAITIPGGLQLKYPGLQRNAKGDWEYFKAGAGKPTKIFGGFVLENIVQAVAGRMLREAIVRIKRERQDILVVTNTHDELLNLIDDRPELMQYRDEVSAKLAEIAAGAKGIKMPFIPDTDERRFVEAALTMERDYLPGLPIAVESDYGYRYGDAK